jgi:RNA polymerase-binding protein DksA
MATINVDKFKQRILADQKRLLADRRKLLDDEINQTTELVNFDVNHPGDLATETFEKEKDIALNENIDGLLAQIDEALQKIDAGTYGVCDRCGKQIPAARLDALPYATLCVDCQGRFEGQ